MEKKIRVNKIKCRKCGNIIESTSVHDFRFCSCGACAVDGGIEYLKRVGEHEDWEELSEFDEARTVGRVLGVVEESDYPTREEQAVLAEIQREKKK